jgi:hypothetical protein
MEEDKCAKIVHATMCRELMRIAKSSKQEDMGATPEFKRMLDAINVLEELHPKLKEYGV